MKKDFVREHHAKRKYTTQGMWFLIVFFLVLLSILGRFALRRGAGIHFLSEMPSGEDAFQVAKDFVKPTLTSPDVEFANDDYDSSKETDSVYVVKSYFQAAHNGTKTTFVVKIKYLGGDILNDQSWNLMFMQQQ